MSKSETVVERVERELRALVALFRRNGLLGAVVVITALGYGVWSLGSPLLKNTDGAPLELTRAALQQAQAYQDLFKQFQAVSAELAASRLLSKDVEIKRLETRLTAMQVQLRQSVVEIEKKADRLAIGSTSSPGLSVAASGLREAAKEACSPRIDEAGNVHVQCAGLASESIEQFQKYLTFADVAMAAQQRAMEEQARRAQGK